MKSSSLCCVLLAVVLCVPVFAAEEPIEPPDNLARLLRHADRGDPLGPEQLAAIERFAKKHLARVRCNTLEDASFSLAQLEVNADRGKEAIETLTKLADSTKSADVKSAALYDIGKVHRVVLGDVKSAGEAFLKVTGRFAVRAKREMLRMYQEAGQGAKAVQFLQAAIAKTKDKGEKLGLLRRLAELCKKAGKTEDAIAAYRQITQEFTTKDLDELKGAAVKRVRKAFERSVGLQAKEQWREAEAIMRETRIWIGQFAEAGRLDEFRAAQQELEKGWRRAREKERERDEAEKKKAKEEAEDDEANRAE